MFKNWISITAICLSLLQIHCGTGIGNGGEFQDPTAAPLNVNPEIGEEPGVAPGVTISEANFAVPISQYDSNMSTDCGSFTEASTVESLDLGRLCIADALLDCTEAKYLYNKTNTDGSRFVSYVAVELTPSGATPCQLRVHTVSNASSVFYADRESTCTELKANELIEFACGIGDN